MDLTKELIAYVFFGVLTTIVNFITYFLFASVLASIISYPILSPGLSLYYSHTSLTESGCLKAKMII